MSPSPTLDSQVNAIQHGYVDRDGIKRVERNLMSDDASRSYALPELSVVIPAYNRGEIVLTAVRSVLDQADQSIEVIVVDDGSTDNTADVVEALRDLRVRVIRAKHQGVSSARNTGADTARSKFLTFLDSDDVARPGWVAAMIEAARRDLDLFSCASIERWPDGLEEIVQASALSPAFANLCAQYQAGCFGVRAEIFLRAGGYLPELRYGEGTHLMLGLARLHLADPLRTGTTNEPLVIVHRRPRPYDASLYYESGSAALDTAFDMLSRDGKAFGAYLAIKGTAASRLGHRREAVNLFCRAVKADPKQWRHVVRLIRAFLAPQQTR